MTYELKNQDLSVQFASKGGALSSIKDAAGIEYLWQGDGAYWTGQAPILFPICGSIRDDKAVLKDGRKVAMPRHGLIRKKEFVMEKQTENQITFSIQNDEEMKEKYPFDFKVFITYTLIEKQIQVTYRVQNLSAQTMPFQIGGHPGFNCPLEEGEDYTDYEVVFDQEENCSVATQFPKTGLLDVEKRVPCLSNQQTLPLDFSLFEVDALTFDQLASKKVTLRSKKSGKGVSVSFAELPYLILWTTANHGPFLAMEPWSGLSTCMDESDVFEEKRGMLSAAPGESVERSFTIEVVS